MRKWDINCKVIENDWGGGGGGEEPHAFAKNIDPRRLRCRRRLTWTQTFRYLYRDIVGSFVIPRMMGAIISLGCNWWKNMHQIDR